MHLKKIICIYLLKCCDEGGMVASKMSGKRGMLRPNWAGTWAGFSCAVLFCFDGMFFRQLLFWVRKFLQ